jgi:hypothetical protein
VYVDCERSWEKCEDDVTGMILPGMVAGFNFVN